jgi:hypothetical protein
VTTATVSGWMKRLCMEILLKRRYVLSKSDNNRLRHHGCSEMGDVQRCPPFYYVQDTPVCHRFMLIASYACVYSRGSCVQGVAAADQLAEALAYVKNTLGQESTVSLVDERPVVSRWIHTSQYC